jgi:isoaspartyl peptidase/L-asparaginase-like protein (Ntn-hydrolase superfamily)
MAGVGAAASSVGLGGLPAIRVVGGRVDPGRVLVVATWPFAKAGTEKARDVVLAGGSALDAVEQGICVVEVIGNGSVGLTGGPNAAGYVQQDACIMNGPGHRAGSVAGIEGIVHPISAARRVMEYSKHVMLVGEGARWFALHHGLESVDVTALAALKEAWLAKEGVYPPKPAAAPQIDEDDHDTVALMVLHPGGDIAGGCSTSGVGGKLPGRVGDSPILGSGLYVDNRFGAAGGTGLGENAMRHCASFQIVERMRDGMSPEAACAETLHRIAEHDPLGYELQLSFCALDRKGRWGAATTHRFSCSVTTQDSSEVHEFEALPPR